MALIAMIAVFIWASIILFISCYKEQHMKKKMRDEIMQEHAKQMN
jgi:hypothetical protein